MQIKQQTPHTLTMQITSTYSQVAGWLQEMIVVPSDVSRHLFLPGGPSSSYFMRWYVKLSWCI